MDNKRPYWPALDGLRGFAVLFVVMGHVGLILGPTGGEVGVTVFFVLSGFLITNILVSELRSTGSISFRRFYARRARRLIPALTFFLLGLGAVLSIWIPLDQIWQASWPALFYVANYAQILGYDVFHNTHTWSLAIEEHFYLIWPSLFLLAPQIRRSGKLIALVLGFVILRLAIGTFNNSWAYQGTLTNAYALLLGCALAMGFWEKVSLRLPRRSAELALGGLVLLGQWTLSGAGEGVFWTLDSVSVWLPPIAAALAAVAIWDLIHRDDKSIFDAAGLRYMGRISYGWYLWHAPFMFISIFNYTLASRMFWAVVTFGIAALSWHFLERPIIERGKVGRLGAGVTATP